MDGCWSRKVEVKRAREQSRVGDGEEDEDVRGRERKIDLPRAYLRYAFYSFLSARSLARSLAGALRHPSSSFLPSLYLRPQPRDRPLAPRSRPRHRRRRRAEKGHG